MNNVRVSEFALDPKLKEYIRDSKEAFAAKCASLDVDHLEYQTFTKKLIKERNLSPDAIMQFAIQVICCHKPGCTATVDGKRFKILYLGRRDIVLSTQRKQRC